MHGTTGGDMGTKLEIALNIKIAVKHHCLSHRLQLVVKNSMEEYEEFSELEVYVQKYYTFYKVSHKRYNDLLEFLEEISQPTFRLLRIFDVRWLDSHKRAINIVLQNWYALHEHLKKLHKQNQCKTPKKQTKAFCEKIEVLIKYLTNKVGHRR